MFGANCIILGQIFFRNIPVLSWTPRKVKVTSDMHAGCE